MKKIEKPKKDELFFVIMKINTLHVELEKIKNLILKYINTHSEG